MDRKAKITKSKVDALSPEEGRFLHWDTEIAGYGIKVAPTRRKSYVFRYRVNGGRGGRSREPVIGVHGNLTKDQARDIAKRWAAEVAAGGDPAGDRQERRDAPKVSNLLDRYLSDHVEVKNKAATARNVKALVKALIRPALGRFKITEVTRAEISKFHSSIAKTPYQANRALAALLKAFSRAEVWGMRPDHSNPCFRIERFEEKSRERFLTIEEFERLSRVLDLAERHELLVAGESGAMVRQYINPEALLAFRLVLVTGARIGEILALRWAYIDAGRQRADLPDSKTCKKVLQLPEVAFGVLAKLADREKEGGFVARGEEGKVAEIALVNVKDPWRIVRTAAGLNDVRINDLRHTYASVAVGSGMSLPMLGGLLGHKDPKTTQRDAHLANDPLRVAADGVAWRIASAMGGKGSHLTQPEDGPKG